MRLRAFGLTRREQEVLRLVVLGLSTTAIAQTLVLSPCTTTRATSFEKTGARTRRDLVTRLFFADHEPGLTTAPLDN
jgi:DNA-binding NarL/FixJ family response regulator